MSEALARVIAEQQAEIDRFKAREQSSIKDWKRAYEKEEKLMSAVFSFLNSKYTHEDQMRMRQTIMETGWCLQCEVNPCECEIQYD